MPSLELFGHKTLVAGDDLRCFSVTVLLLRLVQLALLIPTMVYWSRIDATSTTSDECDAVRATNGDDDSSGAWLFGRVVILLYWVLSILVFVVVGILLDVCIFRVSSQGTPTQPEKRASLHPLCCLKIIPFSLFRILIFVLGIFTMIIFDNFCTCKGAWDTDDNVWLEQRCPDYEEMRTILLVIVSLQCVEVSCAVLIYFCLIFKTVRPRRLLPGALAVEAESKWTWFFRCCCTCTSLITCCLLSTGEAIGADFADISMALADFIDDGGHLDVTMSDIMAGLVMVRREQKQKAMECREKIVAELKNSNSSEEHDEATSDEDEEENVGTEDGRGKLRRRGQRESIREFNLARGESNAMRFEASKRFLLDKENAEDLQLIAEGAHLIRLSLAVYGYLMYMIQHVCTGPCVLAATSLNCRRSCCCWTDENQVVGDTLCGCNMLAMLRESGLNEEDIIYAHFSARVDETPYCIVVDRPWKSIVLVIRGTLSLEDIVADLTIRPVSLMATGERCGFDGSSYYAHGGMLACAEWIYNDLERHGALNKLLSDETSEYAGFRLFITGHSLGAGCAAILSLMLQSRFNDLQCRCFEPPGCVLSADACQQPFLISYIQDVDIVPRLSLQSMESLRDDVLEMIARIKVPKHIVLDPYVGEHRGLGLIESNRKVILHRQESVPTSPFSEQLAKFRSHQKERKAARQLNSDYEDALLFPPGRLIHLVKTASDRMMLSVPSVISNLGVLSRRRGETDGDVSADDEEPLGDRPYTAVWAQREDFSQVQLSTSILSDHDAGTNMRELETLAVSFGLDPPHFLVPCPATDEGA